MNERSFTFSFAFTFTFTFAFAFAGCSNASSPTDGGSSGSDGGSSGSSDGGTTGWFHDTFTNDAGSRDYATYVPSGFQPGLPLVMVLHGCTQTIDQIEAATRYDALAESKTFIAVFPQQSSAANMILCWDWYASTDQQRGMGEPSILAGIVQSVAARWSTDPKRTYVIGGSAGGAMSVVLGATYPDLFAAIGVVAGCEYNGAPCGSNGGPNPTSQGQEAYQAMASNARVVPVLVYQGDADQVVPPVNGDQVVQQWIATDDWADDGSANGSVPTAASSTMMGTVPNGRSYTVTQFGVGTTVVEKWLVAGAGHAWPGGPSGATFTDPTGPDATGHSYDFFLAHAKP